MFSRKPSPAMLVALAALFVALGGTSYAALQLPRNAVKAKQIAANAVGASEIRANAVGASEIRANAVGASEIRANAVRGSEVRNGSLRAADFAAGQLPKGDKGDRGDPGAAGAPGAPAIKLFAEISGGAASTVLYGQGVTGVTNAGTFYVITFDRDISQCAPLGTTTGTNGNNVDARINVVHRAGGPTMLNVRTYTGASENAVTNVPFSIALLC